MWELRILVMIHNVHSNLTTCIRSNLETSQLENIFFNFQQDYVVNAQKLVVTSGTINIIEIIFR